MPQPSARRHALIESNLVDAPLRDGALGISEAPPQVLSPRKNDMSTLPGQLLCKTQISVCSWFLAKNKAADAKRGFRLASPFGAS